MGLTDLRRNDGCAVVTLSRSDKRNAVNHALVDELEGIFARVQYAGDAVIVLQATPPTFCAGADLQEFLSDPAAKPATTRLLDLLLETPLLVVTVVEGDALGAGVALAALSPVVVAASTARFQLPEVEVGIYPGGVLVYLEQVVSARLAHTLAITGTPLSAAAAQEGGLVTEVVAPERARARGLELAVAYSQRPRLAGHAATAWTTRFRTPGFHARQSALDLLVEVPDR